MKKLAVFMLIVLGSAGLCACAAMNGNENNSQEHPQGQNGVLLKGPESGANTTNVQNQGMQNATQHLAPLTQ